MNTLKSEKGNKLNIESSVYKNLVAVTTKKKLINIPNRIIRKLKWKEEQDKELSSNSVCIVCNYSFLTKTRGWSKKVGAICHPFKETSIFGEGRKLYLFSESDWCDSLWMEGLNFCSPKKEYKYEFFIFTIDQIQGVRCKGYHLIPMIARVAEEMGVRGIVLDYYHVFPRPSCKKEEKGSDGWATEQVRGQLKQCKNIDIVRGVQTQKRITELMADSRYVIFPNSRDASPRTIVETLLRGKPCLVNENIYGGWKYINSNNGLFFDGAITYSELIENENRYYEEIKRKMKEIREINFDNTKIVAEHMSKYGFRNASHRFAEIINEVEGDKKYSYVAYKEFDRYLKKHCT